MQAAHISWYWGIKKRFKKIFKIQTLKEKVKIPFSYLKLFNTENKKVFSVIKTKVHSKINNDIYDFSYCSPKETLKYTFMQIH